MLDTIVGTLVDRCIQLVERRQQRKRLLLEEHIDPLMDAFEKVHSSYLMSFQELRAAASSDRRDVKHLLEQLKIDSRFSMGDRVVMLDGLKSEKLADEPTLVAAIRKYMWMAEPYTCGLPEFERWFNPMRGRLGREWLMHLIEDPRVDGVYARGQVVEEIDYVVERLQESYGEVIAAYKKVRHEMLGV